MNVTRRTISLAVATIAAALCLTGVSFGSDWPTRQVTILVPTAAGGNTDLMARMAAEHLSQKLGQPFVVENRPSAGGALTSTQVSTAEPDGHTILFAPHSMILLTPLVQKISFDPNKLVPVTNVGTGSQVVAVKRDLPVKTLQEFLDYAKTNPGKLNYAIAGANNISHLGPALLFKRAGVDLVMVPARGEPQAITDLMAGNADLYFGNASILLQHQNHEKIRILAVGTAARSPRRRTFRPSPRPFRASCSRRGTDLRSGRHARAGDEQAAIRGRRHGEIARGQQAADRPRHRAGRHDQGRGDRCVREGPQLLRRRGRSRGHSEAVKLRVRLSDDCRQERRRLAASWRSRQATPSSPCRPDFDRSGNAHLSGIVLCWLTTRLELVDIRRVIRSAVACRVSS